MSFDMPSFLFESVVTGLGKFEIIGEYPAQNQELPMVRMFTGFTSSNPNYEDGPTGDWPFLSDTQLGWRFTSALPVPQCGAQVQAGS